MRLALETLSQRYSVQTLTVQHLPQMLALCAGNGRYFEYMHEQPSDESLRRTMEALPTGTQMEDKHFLGWFDGTDLVAILDLITAYPNEATVFIGWLIVEKAKQQHGVGTHIVRSLLPLLREAGFSKVRLGCIERNTEALCFWQKQGFALTGERSEQENYTVLLLERAI